jgi:hypothetical protein
MLQRYVLAASQAVAGSWPASSTAVASVVTATVPLGGRWTVRLRNSSGVFAAGDNSGQLSVSVLSGNWQLLDAHGNVFYFLNAWESDLTPNFTMPTINGAGFAKQADTNLVLSSYDQIGGVAVGLNFTAAIIAHNNDAAAAHPGTVSCTAIVEFDDPGSS